MKPLRQTFLLVLAAEKKAAEELADPGGIKRGARGTLLRQSKPPFGNNAVHMGMGVGAIGTKRPLVYQELRHLARHYVQPGAARSRASNDHARQ